MPAARTGAVARAVALAVALGAATPAGADDPETVAVGSATAVPATIAELLTAQLASATRARGQVEARLAERADARHRRVRVAYKLLRGVGSPLTVAPERRLAVARSRATARLLLARDRTEVAQLADEIALLTTAIGRIERDRAAPSPVAPTGLLRPVVGAIARRFGTLVHERSGATLARRGLDFDVAPDAVVVAPADGVVGYAGPIRGLDQGVVIDHGGYWTVLAKLAPVTLTRGDTVARGAPIGHPDRRRVYFEVRLGVGPGGTPVDPEPLVAAPR